MHIVEMDFIPNDMDIYEVNISSQSTIDYWWLGVTHWKSRYYSFYVEFVKVDNKVVSEYVNIDLQDVDLLVVLYAILKERSKMRKNCQVSHLIIYLEN